MAPNGTAPVLVETIYDPEKKVWHGPVDELRYGPQYSIGSAVLEAMKKYPDHVIQICHQSGKEITNREMIKLTVQAARHFEKLQLQQCDIIGICAGNSDYVAPIYFGALCAGLCISPLDPSFNVNGLKYVYNLTQPKLMFCDGEIYQKVRQALEECGLSATKIFTVRNHMDGIPNVMEFFEEICDASTYVVPPLREGFEQVAMILRTSGSTGPPKGIQMSHAALLNATTLGVDFAPRLLCYGSLYGSVPTFMMIQSATDCFTRIISENPFTPEEFIDIVKMHKINVSANFPADIPLLLTSGKLASSDLSSLRLMFVAGKTIPYSLIEKLMPYAKNCTFRTYYGLTEICGALTSSPVDPSDAVGRMLVNTEAKILSDKGMQLGPNEVGEILVRKKYPGSGYFKNPEATKAVYDEDGWVHTGDLGYFNDAGQLYVVDRRKDMLKYNNFTLSPTNIEKVICEIPEVALACVVGIPDETCDFLPAAGVIKRQGVTISEAQIAQHVADRMDDYEILRGGVYFFDSFPLTVTGKTNRSEVTEMCIKRRQNEGNKIIGGGGGSVGSNTKPFKILLFGCRSNNNDCSVVDAMEYETCILQKDLLITQDTNCIEYENNFMNVSEKQLDCN
ncbi:luciferin 4-monooxygenase-like [Musca vetustissima]|uniref:luciferin 4-monooxygenase-like n=1 Tax=Musca vetustissima TaxID=27455 RepID=UPI002AB7DE62|nr:luciferin 4-monooxygenase-like [Musca vetustissima]